MIITVARRELPHYPELGRRSGRRVHYAEDWRAESPGPAAHSWRSESSAGHRRHRSNLYSYRRREEDEYNA